MNRTDLTLTTSRPAILGIAPARSDIVGGLVSSAVAIPLAMAFGMFAFVTLGDEYFAYGAMAGLISAVTAGFVCVLLGDRSTRVYAPRITTTFFLGLLLFSLLHRDGADTAASVPATLLVFFAIILLGGLLQALFGLMRLGTLIKFAPHPVMAGFQNMAAALLFLVQFGNVLGFDKSIGFTRAFGLSWLRAAAERAGRRPDFCGDVACSKDHHDCAAGAGWAWVRHRCFIMLRAFGFRGRAGSGHWPADRERRDEQRAG